VRTTLDWIPSAMSTSAQSSASRFFGVVEFDGVAADVGDRDRSVLLGSEEVMVCNHGTVGAALVRTGCA
jgi:hypothetical protein